MENNTKFNDLDRINLHAASKGMASPAVGRERVVEADAKMLEEHKRRTRELLQTEQNKIAEIGKLLKYYRQEEAVDLTPTLIKEEFQGDYELAG